MRSIIWSAMVARSVAPGGSWSKRCGDQRTHELAVLAREGYQKMSREDGADVQAYLGVLEAIEKESGKA